MGSEITEQYVAVIDTTTAVLMLTKMGWSGLVPDSVESFPFCAEPGIAPLRRTAMSN
jgi:hypothetical protein